MTGGERSPENQNGNRWKKFSRVKTSSTSSDVAYDLGKLHKSYGDEMIVCGPLLYSDPYQLYIQHSQVGCVSEERVCRQPNVVFKKRYCFSPYWCQPGRCEGLFNCFQGHGYGRLFRVMAGYDVSPCADHVIENNVCHSLSVFRACVIALWEPEVCSIHDCCFDGWYLMIKESLTDVYNDLHLFIDRLSPACAQGFDCAECKDASGIRIDRTITRLYAQQGTER